MKRLPLILFCAVFALSIWLDAGILASEEATEHWWSRIYGFFPLYGFVGCLATIWIAKVLGDRWLTRRENYYESKERDE
jgi:hypothetical protein